MSIQLLATQQPGKNGGGTQLRPAMSLNALVALGIGAVIGAGVFVLTGTAAANYAGPALALSFLIAGLGCAFAGLCYAEFAAMVPVCGSAYSYTYVACGELAAWLVGWNLVLEYLFSVATVSVGWSGYVVSLLAQLGLHLPEALTTAPFARGNGPLGLVRTGALLNLPAVLVVSTLTVVCYRGIQTSSAVNLVIVITKVTIILLFIFAGVSVVNPENWHPFVPANEGAFGQFGWTGVMLAAGVIFFAFLGFDAISTTVQEAKNPQRDVPRALLISLAACTLLYIAVALVLTGMVPFRLLDVPAPVAFALDQYSQLWWLAMPIKIGAIAGMTSVVLVGTLGQARVFLSMARDGLLPARLANVHERYRTPSAGTIVSGATAAVVGGLFPVTILGELVSVGTLLAFSAVCLGVLVMRVRAPRLERPFRVPMAWFTCTAGMVTCLGLMLSMPADTWMRLWVWTAIGLLLYAVYGFWHSRLRDRPRAAHESNESSTAGTSSLVLDEDG